MQKLTNACGRVVVAGRHRQKQKTDTRDERDRRKGRAEDQRKVDVIHGKSGKLVGETTAADGAFMFFAQSQRFERRGHFERKEDGGDDDQADAAQQQNVFGDQKVDSEHAFERRSQNEQAGTGCRKNHEENRLAEQFGTVIVEDQTFFDSRIKVR